METIREGKVKIKIPKFKKVSSEAPVFYNPAMKFDRDLSVIILQQFQKEINKEISVADTFGASGIRGIRYFKEVKNVNKVFINDIDETAVKFIKKNVALNNIEAEVSQEEANIFLRKNRGKFDIIDIDPFGTPSPFIDSTLYSAKRDSLLCITATDTSALCGTYRTACIRKYNSVPLKTEYCHENAVRILMAFVAMNGAKYDKYIVPKFSHSTKHYVRLYLKVKKGAKKTDKCIDKNIGFILHCNNCFYRETRAGLSYQHPSECPSCGHKLHVGGPLWVGKVYDPEFVKEIRKSIVSYANQKILKFIEVCSQECEMPATYYDVHRICSDLRISAPKIDKIINSLRELGFRATRTHYSPVGIKTDAPVETIKKVIRKLSNATHS